jgi:hypothetical protein
VSSVIRCAEDCIGVAAVLPLSVFRDQLPVQQALKVWKKRLQGSKDRQSDLAVAVESSKTAILVSERVLNSPPELATPLVAGLASEIKALAAEKSAPERVHAHFDLLLHCATAYVDSGSGAHDLGAVPVSAASSTAVRFFTHFRNWEIFFLFKCSNRCAGSGIVTDSTFHVPDCCCRRLCACGQALNALECRWIRSGLAFCRLTSESCGIYGCFSHCV